LIHQLELQLFDMPYSIEDFVACVWGETTIVRKPIKLLDYLITSTVHAGYPGANFCPLTVTPKTPQHIPYME
jgi:hypothetical protein